MPSIKQLARLKDYLPTVDPLTDLILVYTGPDEDPKMPRAMHVVDLFGTIGIGASVMRMGSTAEGGGGGSEPAPANREFNVTTI